MEEEFAAATECHICQKYFTEYDVRVRDHCHITGKYRGAAHNEFNINFRLTNKIRNLLIRYVIPNNLEKFIGKIG